MLSGVTVGKGGEGSVDSRAEEEGRSTGAVRLLEAGIIMAGDECRCLSLDYGSVLKLRGNIKI